MSSELALLTEVVAALKGDAVYMATIPGGLHDGTAPKGTAFPYTTLDGSVETLEATHDVDGYHLVITFSDWTELEGKTEALEIRNARDDVLHNTILSPVGWGATSIRRDFGTVQEEWDADLKKTLRHGVSRYRVSTLKDA